LFIYCFFIDTIFGPDPTDWTTKASVLDDKLSSVVQDLESDSTTWLPLSFDPGDQNQLLKAQIDKSVKTYINGAKTRLRSKRAADESAGEASQAPALRSQL